jgi:hypothetical protein
METITTNNYLVCLEKGLTEFHYLVDEGVCFEPQELELVENYIKRLRECAETVRLLKQLRK